MGLKQFATIAIIGRPNVGKSTLFNTLIGERKAIESSIAGTTRDSLIEKISAEKFDFWLVDTAGLTDTEGDDLELEIQRQADIASHNADILLFLVDGMKDLTSDDYRLAEKLRRVKKPVMFVATKVDDGSEARTWNLAELGLGMPHVISARNFVGISTLLDEIEGTLAAEKFATRLEISAENLADDSINVAFVGRPNVGKSSLLNSLVRTNRSVVSNVAGTTRDSLDSEMWWHEATNLYDRDPEKLSQKVAKWIENHPEDEISAENPGETTAVRIIDTAGLRRPGKVQPDFEFWSVVRTQRAIERADVCALLIDALDGVTHQDLVIAGKILEAGKGLILCVNKFDLAAEKSKAKEDSDERELSEVKMWDERLDKIRDQYMRYLSEKIKFVPWAPVLFFSAKTGKGVGDIFRNAKAIAAERIKRVSTADLNRYIPEMYYGHVTPSIGTKQGKIKYASQVESAPPKFVFHVNNKAAFHFTYRRYIENKLREKYGFHGTPIEIDIRDSMETFRGKKK